jgi:hypothetical protein
MTTKSVKMTALAAVALLGSAVAVNCSNSPKSYDNTGSLSLGLTLPSGVKIDTVHWKIASAQPVNPPAAKEGDIDTSDVNATASVETSYPASTNDKVTLTAKTSRGEDCVGSSAEFTTPGGGAQVLVNVTLVCGQVVTPSNSGSVRVTGQIDDQSDLCPVLTTWGASPLQTSKGSKVTISSDATDADPEDTLAYAWTAAPAAAGAFGDAAAKATTFTCPGDGDFALTVTVTDSHKPKSCSTSKTISVHCVGSAVCGNGLVEGTEECDAGPAGSASCTTDCKKIAVCGNNVVEAPEECDSAAAFANNTCGKAGAANACKTIPVVCGDGLVQPGEECDSPDRTKCTAACKAVAQVSQCLTCEIAGTTANICSGTKAPGASVVGCDGYTDATKKAQCKSLLNCLQTHPTCSGTPAIDDPTACLCGALDAGSCAAAAAPTIAGVCADAYFALYGATDAASRTAAQRDALLGDFFNGELPVGLANNLYACDVDANCQSKCP